jgi:hypothetical protein
MRPDGAPRALTRSRTGVAALAVAVVLQFAPGGVLWRPPLQVHASGATPVVSGISPNSAAATLTSGFVTIYGSGFRSATSVRFGTVGCVNFYVFDDSTIQASPPGGAAGTTVDVYVTGPGGTSAASAADRFTYVAVATAVPSINGITPNSGPAPGGTFITLVGTGFSAVTRALFGSTSVPVYPYYGADDNRLYIYAPPGTPGSTVDIKVVNPAGTSAASAADRYTYLASAAPSVRAVLPNRGPAAGGTGVTIFGHGLAGTTTVHFGAVPATINYQSGDESIFVNSPPGTAGAIVDVTVTTPLGTSPVVNAGRFTYSVAITPRVDAISANRGPAVGGQNVSLFGVGFAGATSVAFGTVAASFTVYDDGNMNATAPAGTAGTVVDVRVTTPAGTSGVALQDQYRYLSLGSPEVDAVTPNRGPAAGGTSVIIVGSGLFNPTAVRFGSAAATTYSASTDGTTVTATSPPGTGGTSVDIVVATSAGLSAVGATDRFSYVSASSSAPIINALDPNHGSQYGGSALTIHGSGFTTTGMTVMFGTTSTTNFNVTGPGTIAVYSAPAGTVGTTVDVMVSTASGTSAATPADRYTFDAVAAPVVTAISPNTAPAGAAVYITGAGVGSATSVTFGSTSVGVTTFVGADNVIQVTSPPGTAGSTVDVRVTNPTGTSAVSTADQFTYSNTPVPVPTVTGVGPSSGTAAGRTTVYVSGSGFLSGISSVKFGAAPASSFYAISDNVLQAVSPAHAVGLVDLTVANSSGPSATTSADGYTFTTAPVPSVTNVSPSGGPSNGGPTVYVSGSGFTGATTVSAGNTALSSGSGFTVNSDSLITIYRSSAQGTNPSTVDITVTAPGGTSPASTADRFTFGAPVVPTVTAISPTTGPATGFTLVHITGTGFLAATAVNFGATTVAAGSISDTLISVFSPAQGTNPATVDVTVTAGGSISATSTADQFTWGSTPPPTGPVVNGVSPNQGITAGGTNVTVFGSGLGGATAVNFGAAPGVIQYSNSTQIGVRSPAGAVGTVDITVTTGAGTSSTSTADHFTYVTPTAPVINAVDPNHGTALGGGSATVYGHGFTGATAVHFGTAAANSFFLGGDTYLYVYQVPAGTVGSIDVTVTGPGGTSGASAADHYTYMAAGTPAVYAVSPNRGSTLGGPSVTIYGSGLAGTNSVTFGTSAASFYPGYQYDIQLYAQSPPGAAATVDVAVSTGAGTSVHQASDLFTYMTPGPPVVHAVAPNRGSAGGGTSVRLIGSSLSNATAVSFGSVAASFFSNNGDSEVDVTSPTASVGTVHITVTTPFGTSAVSAADQFTFFSPPVPAVTAVSPNSGSAAGGTLVFISGSGFAGATNLLFGSACSVLGFTPISDNLIETSTPVGTTGATVDIQVATPGGTSATGVADLFTYTAASPPMVTAVGPASGPSVGQTFVYITGTNLISATSVSFGATPAAYFYPYYTTYGQSNNVLIAGSPPGTAGATVDITVTTSGGVSSVSSSDRFTYVSAAAPSVTAVSPSTGPFVGGALTFITGSGLLAASAVHFGTQAVTKGSPNGVDRSRQSRSVSASPTSPHLTVRLPIGGRTTQPGAQTPERFAQVAIPLPRSAKSSATVAGGLARGPRGAASSATTPGSARSVAQATAFAAPMAAAAGGTCFGAGGGGAGGGGPSFIPFDDNVIGIFATPAGTNGSTVDVTVTTPAGTSPTSTADHYTYGATPAPSISALGPSGGPSGGGTDVLISGSNFTMSTMLKFGTVPASLTSYYGETLIGTTSPPGTAGTTVDVTATNPGGTSALSADDQFTYAAPPAPVVSIVKPTGGPGGTTAFVSGSSLAGTTAVNFGTASAAGHLVLGDNLVEVVAPAGTSGATVDVTATTAGGTSATSTADQFTFAATPAPAVTIVSPNSGPASTTIYVTGTGFTCATAVNFGPTPGTALVVISDTLIQVASPAGSGSVDVRVVGLGGTSAMVAGDLYNYTAASAPSVTGVSPNTGPISGGTAVTISGTSLGGATVRFGTVSATVTSTGTAQITAVSPAASGPGTVDITVTTAAGTSPVSTADQFMYGNILTRVSTLQYQLTNSDGTTWVDMDSAGNLMLRIAPATSVQVILTANADLWTANAGFNQDIGIDVNGSIVGWKESGGFAGTFSPNAAFVQTEVSMAGGTTYTVKLRWKTNKNAPGATIYAGAGPISTQFSPTRLTAQIVTTTAPMALTTQQYALTNSNGSTWTDMDSTNLNLTLTPSANSTAIIGGNSDLWTANAGYNQDLAITINGTVAAWKESGGFAGTFSPNAAYVQTVQNLTAGTAYTIKLQWKTNKAAVGTIYAGAGPINSQFSPTSLIVQLFPASVTLPNKLSTQQYQLTGSDGAVWTDIDGSGNLTLTVTPGVNTLAVLSGNADLWTSSAGYNQDLGIDVNGTIVAWKESGGFAGTFSPNAAYVQAVIPMNAGTTYTIKLRWKTNKAAPGATIWAGAGPIGTQYSPTGLAVQFAS